MASQQPVFPLLALEEALWSMNLILSVTVKPNAHIYHTVKTAISIAEHYRF